MNFRLPQPHPPRPSASNESASPGVDPGAAKERDDFDKNKDKNPEDCHDDARSRRV